eukprot:COSAG01_NODE_21331_length_907_cov_0.798267_2_plen_122_part_01
MLKAVEPSPALAATLLHACDKGPDCVDALLEAGCNATAKDKNGATALILAAYEGKAAVVRTLLAWEDTEIEAKDTDGDTAFLAACFQGNVECMDALLKEGCDPTVRNNNDETALMFAASSRN